MRLFHDKNFAPILTRLDFIYNWKSQLQNVTLTNNNSILLERDFLLLYRMK
jgi:hypothetical protein